MEEVYYAGRYNRVGYHKQKMKSEQQQNVLRSVPADNSFIP